MPADDTPRWWIRDIRPRARMFWDSLDAGTRDEVTRILCECPKPYPNDPNGNRKGHMRGRRFCIWHFRRVCGDKAIFYVLDEVDRAIDFVTAGPHDIYDR